MSPGKKRPVETADNEQKEKPPQETQTEVFTFLRLIVILNKKAESEQQGENRVSFPGKEKKQCFPYSFIHRLHKSRRSCREVIKIKMFDVV